MLRRRAARPQPRRLGARFSRSNGKLWKARGKPLLTTQIRNKLARNDFPRNRDCCHTILHAFTLQIERLKAPHVFVAVQGKSKENHHFVGSLYGLLHGPGMQGRGPIPHCGSCIVPPPRGLATPRSGPARESAPETRRAQSENKRPALPEQASHTAGSIILKDTWLSLGTGGSLFGFRLKAAPQHSGPSTSLPPLCRAQCCEGQGV